MADASFLHDLAQQVLNGLVVGAVIALGAVALTLLYAIIRLPNFAHGDLLTLGGFSAFFLVQSIPRDQASLWVLAFALALLAWALYDRGRARRLSANELRALLAAVVPLALSAWWFARRDPTGAVTGLDLVAAAFPAIAFVAFFSVGLDRVLWQRLRRRGASMISLLITSIGVALVLRNVLLLQFGGGLRVVSRPNRVDRTFFGLTLSNEQAFALLLAGLAVLAVHLFLTRTRTGKAMRALADNKDLARVCGIDAERTTLHLWVLAGGLTALAGLLLAFTVRRDALDVNMGWHLLLPLFAAVILGGIGSAYGAMLGAVIVGVAMKTSGLWLGVHYDVAAAFVLLILVLLVRPQGILGGKIR